MRIVIGVALVISLFAAPQLFAADLKPIADTYTDSAASTTNFGSASVLRVGNKLTRTALVRFDTSSIPATGTATLKVRVRQMSSGGMLWVKRVLGNWSESTVTAGTLPNSVGIASLAITPADVGKTLSIDVSSALALWISNPASNFGLALEDLNGPTKLNVYFDSRETATGPVLSVASPNLVTVAKSGGDYADPIAAANNAFSGDTWCHSTGSQTSSCTMQIKAGIFILPGTLTLPPGISVTGDGTGDTQLIARKGLELAVIAQANFLSDLTIVNNQNGLARAIGLRSTETSGSLPITRVTIRVAGAKENVGFQSVGPEDTVLTQSTIVATGGDNAFGIDNNLGFANTTLVDSTVMALDGKVNNIGITQFMDDSGEISLQDSTVVAAGGSYAAGLSLGDEDSSYSIIRGTISASSSTGAARAIAGGEADSGLEVIGTNLSASGPSAIGIFWYGVRPNVLLDGVQIRSTGIAFSSYIEDVGNVRITRSQLAGGTLGMRIEAHRLNVDMDSTVLRAPTVFGSSQPGSASFGLLLKNSVLDGTLSFPTGTTASCSVVYNKDYVILRSNCLP